MTYEERVARLEEIVNTLGGDGLPLERALALFEEGIALLRDASADLTEVDGRIEELVERVEGLFDLRALDE